MKIVLVHGQNHKGSSYTIGRMIADKITGEKTVTEFFLPKDLNHFCAGCYACIDDEEKCPFYAEKRRITAEIEQADVLIFTTPTYCMRASAPMKSFLDLTFTYWMSHKPRMCMFRKRAVIVSTAAGAGAGSAVKDAANALRYWGISDITKYGIAVQAMNWDAVSEKKKAKIGADTDKIAMRLSRAKKPPVSLKTKGLFCIMRMMQIHHMGAGEAERNYWEKNGWLGKNRPWAAQQDLSEQLKEQNKA